MTLSMTAGLAAASLVASACGTPRDPELTLQRVTGGTIRVGVADHEPWTVSSSGEPKGIEVELVRMFAEEIDADVEWVEGQVEELAGALAMGEIDLLIGGLTIRSKVDGALTHPYVTTQVVVAVPEGTDLDDVAGVEVAVERYSEAAGILEKTDAIPVEVDDVTTADGPVVVHNYQLDELELDDTGVTLDETDHVMAVRHGENAWLVRLERFLLSDPERVRRVLEENDHL